MAHYTVSRLEPHLIRPNRDDFSRHIGTVGVRVELGFDDTAELLNSVIGWVDSNGSYTNQYLIPSWNRN
jgi:hypothetical protein